MCNGEIVVEEVEEVEEAIFVLIGAILLTTHNSIVSSSLIVSSPTRLKIKFELTLTTIP